MRRQFLIKAAGRPIHCSAIAIEHFIPIDALASARAVPMRQQMLIIHKLDHVETAAKLELLQREFQRHSTGTPQTSADNGKTHDFTPLIVPPIIKEKVRLMPSKTMYICSISISVI